MDSDTEVFFQWNTQGISTSKEEIVNLIDTYKPSLFSIQETFLGNEFMLNLVDITAYVSKDITITDIMVGY